MRKVMVLIVLGLTALSLLMAGCGNKKTTITTPEGKITVEEGEGGTTTLKTEEGEATWSNKPPSEEELGLPIYPGAKYVPGSGGSGKFSGDEGTAHMASAQFTTDDSFRKVLAWYTEKLGEPFWVTEGTEATWIVESGEQAAKSVNIKSEGGEVKIYLGFFGTTVK